MSESAPEADAGIPSSISGIRWAFRVLEWAAGVVLFLLMAMTFVDVFGRYFFNAPLSFTTDYTRLMMGIVVFAVFPVVFWAEENICVDILDSVYPKRWINARQALINGLSAVGMGFVADRVWFIAERSANKGDLTEFTGVPLAPFYYYISVLIWLTALVLLLNTIRYLRARGPMSPPPGTL